MEHKNYLLELARELRSEILQLNQLLEILFVFSLADLISAKKGQLRELLAKMNSENILVGRG